MDILEYNRKAWDREVAKKNEWCVPVTTDQVNAARAGDWQVVLTPLKPVPSHWLSPLHGIKILGLAAGGGQQGPIFAAAGAQVTIFDNSPAQLQQDRTVAQRDGLQIELIQGDMRDLSQFADDTFDLIFHPCSNCFVPETLPVWQECYRVLKKGGELLSGFINPIAFTIDPELEQKGILQIKYSIPFSDLTSLTDEERKKYTDNDEPLVFGHTLEDQIGGQLKAGFTLTDMYEDTWGESNGLLYKYIDCFIATRSLKP